MARNTLDKDGFYQLIRRQVETPPPPPKPKEEKHKKAKWPKYDKGTWKYRTLKELRKILIPKTTVDFHFIKADSLVVAFDSKKRPRAFKFHNKLDLVKLKALNKTYSDAKVLINAGDNEFLSMSVKSYIKLSSIDRIHIDFKLSASYDDGSSCEVYRAEHDITNINELAHFIIHHRHCIEGVYDVQAECYGFADYTFKIKTMVIHNDRSVKTWKDDFNGFMKKYKLKQF